MTISPASILSASYQTQATAGPASGKTQGSSEQSADAVQLSPAATAKLKGTDADGDGDSH
jgi:hypothetical protein